MIRTTVIKLDEYGGDALRSSARGTSVAGGAPGGSLAVTGSSSSVSKEDEAAHRLALEGELEQTQREVSRLRAEIEEVHRARAQKEKEHSEEITKLNRKLGDSRLHAKALHLKARGPHPKYPPRFNVPDKFVDWGSPHPVDGYNPTAYTAEAVLDNDCTKKAGGWADATDVKRIPTMEWNTDRRASYEALYTFDVHGRPLNPKGRTGMCERGLLGKWGPNHAADPIVTRYDPARPYQLQMVAIQRRDTGVWAIPGGMVDYGETVSATVRREFKEETGNLSDPAQREVFERLVDTLFETGTIVYRGYVDDPRNTDNAWMETMAYHFHCSHELGGMLPLAAGDDAGDVMWLDIDSANYKWQTLYASHKDIVQKAVARLERSSSYAEND